MNPVDVFKTAGNDAADIWTAFRRAGRDWHGLDLAHTPGPEQEWLDRVAAWSGQPVDDSLGEFVRLAAAMYASLPGHNPFLVHPTLRRVDSGSGIALFKHCDGEGLFFGIALPPSENGEGIAIYSFDYDLEPDEIDADEGDSSAAACERELNAPSPEAFALDVLLASYAPDGALHLIGCCDADEADGLDETARDCLGPSIDVADTRLYGAPDLLVKCRYSYPLGYEVQIMARNRAACSSLNDAFMRQIGLSALAFDKHDWADS